MATSDEPERERDKVYILSVNENWKNVQRE